MFSRELCLALALVVAIPTSGMAAAPVSVAAILNTLKARLATPPQAPTLPAIPKPPAAPSAPSVAPAQAPARK